MHPTYKIRDWSRSNDLPADKQIHMPYPIVIFDEEARQLSRDAYLIHTSSRGNVATVQLIFHQGDPITFSNKSVGEGPSRHPERTQLQKAINKAISTKREMFKDLPYINTTNEMLDERYKNALQSLKKIIFYTERELCDYNNPRFPEEINCDQFFGILFKDMHNYIIYYSVSYASRAVMEENLAAQYKDVAKIMGLEAKKVAIQTHIKSLKETISKENDIPKKRLIAKQIRTQIEDEHAIDSQINNIKNQYLKPSKISNIPPGDMISARENINPEKPPNILTSEQKGPIELKQTVDEEKEQPIPTVQAINTSTQSINFQSNVPTKQLEPSLLNKELMIPANGNCLYTTIFIGYLLPTINNAQEFNERLTKLLDSNENSKIILQIIQDCYDNSNAKSLSSDFFQQTIEEFKKNMELSDAVWGGPDEIKILSNKLGITVQEHIKMTSDVDSYIESDTTIPNNFTESSAEIIHIIRDNPTRIEVMNKSDDIETQVTKLISVEDSTTKQHYRLLKTSLPKFTEAEQVNIDATTSTLLVNLSPEEKLSTVTQGNTNFVAQLSGAPISTSPSLSSPGVTTIFTEDNKQPKVSYNDFGWSDDEEDSYSLHDSTEHDSSDAEQENEQTITEKQELELYNMLDKEKDNYSLHNSSDLKGKLIVPVNKIRKLNTDINLDSPYKPPKHQSIISAATITQENSIKSIEQKQEIVVKAKISQKKLADSTSPSTPNTPTQYRTKELSYGSGAITPPTTPSKGLKRRRSSPADLSPTKKTSPNIRPQKIPKFKTTSTPPNSPGKIDLATNSSKEVTKPPRTSRSKSTPTKLKNQDIAKFFTPQSPIIKITSNSVNKDLFTLHRNAFPSLQDRANRAQNTDNSKSNDNSSKTSSNSNSP